MCIYIDTNIYMHRYIKIKTVRIFWAFTSMWTENFKNPKEII